MFNFITYIFYMNLNYMIPLSLYITMGLIFLDIEKIF